MNDPAAPPLRTAMAATDRQTQARQRRPAMLATRHRRSKQGEHTALVYALPTPDHARPTLRNTVLLHTHHTHTHGLCATLFDSGGHVSLRALLVAMPDSGSPQLDRHIICGRRGPWGRCGSRGRRSPHGRGGVAAAHSVTTIHRSAATLGVTAGSEKSMFREGKQ